MAILTNVPSHPPAKFVYEDGDRVGRALNSVVANGAIVSTATVRESVLSRGVRVHSWATVDRSVIMDCTSSVAAQSSATSSSTGTS